MVTWFDCAKFKFPVVGSKIENINGDNSIRSNKWMDIWNILAIIKKREMYVLVQEFFLPKNNSAYYYVFSMSKS